MQSTHLSQEFYTAMIIHPQNELKLTCLDKFTSGQELLTPQVKTHDA